MFRKGLAKKITTVITAASFSPYVIVYEAKASTEAPSTSKDDISTGTCTCRSSRLFKEESLINKSVNRIL